MSRTTRKSLDHRIYSTFEAFYDAEWHDADIAHRRFCAAFNAEYDADRMRRRARALWDRCQRDGRVDDQSSRPMGWRFQKAHRATASGHVRRVSRAQIARGLAGADWDGLVFPGKRDGKARAILGDYW